MADEKSEVRNAIIESKELSSETEDALKAALAEFRDRFKAEATGGLVGETAETA